jgi:aldehyde oxidoreductase
MYRNPALSGIHTIGPKPDFMKELPRMNQPEIESPKTTREIEFTVNAEKRTVTVSQDQTLLDLLRTDLGLTGTKNGCGKGFCGSCTVILNGVAIRSCRTQGLSAHGARVETIESLADAETLHAVQYAFIVEGAVQCGFCTPGMIMSVKALLDHNPDPADKDIRKTLKPHLCRCTGYQPIAKAVRLAARLIQQGKNRIPRNELPIIFPKVSKTPRVPEGSHAVGRSLRDKSILDKVTGTLIYADDRTEPALFGNIVFSSYPSAAFTLDMVKASAVPGVILILTGKDVPGVNALGMLISDQPALAEGRVKCVADPIAVVIAETDRIARTAAALIKVEYSSLPAHFSPETAVIEGAYKIHPAGNICHQAKLQRGDVEAAFRSAVVVVEQCYTTQVVDPGFLEPESGMAWKDKQGRIVVEMGTQSAFDDRRQIASALGLEEAAIVIRQVPMGGAFGAKEDISLQFILALAVWKTGRRVRITLTREDSFLIHPKRHPAQMAYKTALDAAGNLIAVQADITADTGAYASLGPDILENMLTFGAGPYEVPNLDIRGRLVYTNNPPSGAVRGFGVPQVAFALEQQMARMAVLLDMDPLEIRLRNSLRPGRRLASGQLMEQGTAAVETLEALRESLKDFEKPLDTEVWQYGFGIAAAMKNVGFGHGAKETAGAVLEIGNTDLHVWCGTYEYGQGSLIVLKQLVSEALGVDFGSISLGLTGTAASPETGATTASRQTFLSGNAVLGAVQLLKERIIAAAEDFVQIGAINEAVKSTPSSNKTGSEGTSRKSEWIISGSRVQNNQLDIDLDLFSSPFIGLRSDFRYQAPETAGFGTHTEAKTHWSYMYTAQAALVRVHRQNGAVEVLRMWAAQDCGRALNPMNVRSQIEGGVVQGLGFALQEEVVYEKGIPLTRNFDRYRMPRITHIPEIIPIIVEVPDPHGPFGAKGMGESPILAAAPAVINAVYDAAGIWVTRLPIQGKNNLK